MLTRSVMLTIKKRSFALQVLAIISLAGLTSCGPPGPRDLRKGERLIQSGQFAEAIPVLTEGAQLLQAASPTVQATAWNLLGLACHGAGQPAQAARAYLEALKLDRNLWAADYNLGCLRVEQTNFPGAIDCLATYTTSCPKDINGFLLLGRAHLKLAMERAGLERYTELDSAKRAFESAEGTRGTAEACNALGLIELMQRRIRGTDPVKSAIALFKTALEREPHYPPALLNLAIVQQRYANAPREALQSYREYLDLKPVPSEAAEVEKVARQLDVELRITIVPQRVERPAAATNAGPSRIAPAVVENPVPKPAPPPTVRVVQRERPAAVEQPSPPPANPPPAVLPPPRASVESSPAPVTQTAPLDNAANANTNAATTDLPVVPSPEERKPSFAQKLNPLNWFSGKSKKPAETPETTAVPEAAPVERYTYPLYVTPIPGDRKLAEKLAGEGRQAERQSNRTEAIWDYQEATKADPSYFEAGLALGLAMIDTKDYPGALQALGQALTLEATSADARYAFAWVLGRQGYYQDAANELDKLLAAHPREVRGYLLLGNYYADNLAQPKLAREQYLKALDLIDEHSPQAATIRAWLDQHP
jgi:tetratricopeptide (TPR) repeat protein